MKFITQNKPELYYLILRTSFLCARTFNDRDLGREAGSQIDISKSVSANAGSLARMALAWLCVLPPRGGNMGASDQLPRVVGRMKRPMGEIAAFDWKLLTGICCCSLRARRVRESRPGRSRQRRSYRCSIKQQVSWRQSQAFSFLCSRPPQHNSLPLHPDTSFRKGIARLSWQGPMLRGFAPMPWERARDGSAPSMRAQELTQPFQANGSDVPICTANASFQAAVVVTRMR